MNPVDTCIVIVNYKGWEDTIECLESLLKLRNQNFVVELVDNHSPNDSVSRLNNYLSNHAFWKDCFNFLRCTDKQYNVVQQNSQAPKLVLIANDDNKGFSCGNNVGLRYAFKYFKFNYVWLLNNDTTVDSFALDGLINSMQQDEKIVISGSVLLEYDRPQIVQNAGSRMNLFHFTPYRLGAGYEVSKVNEINLNNLYCAPGASLFLKSKFLRETGLLNESYFLYYEEPDLAAKAFEKGYKISMALSSFVYHKEGKSTGISGASYPSERSRIIFIRRHYDSPRNLLRVTIWDLCRVIKGLLKLNFYQAKIVFLGLINGMNCTLIEDEMPRER
jgi:GT2 family glycosyltransferase